MATDYFLQNQSAILEHGFWAEDTKSALFFSLELRYKKEIIMNWQIVDVVMREKNVLIKWQKRYNPLTDEEYQSKYL